jgi:hypothetical protein
MWKKWALGRFFQKPGPKPCAFSAQSISFGTGSRCIIIPVYDPFGQAVSLPNLQKFTNILTKFNIYASLGT